MTQKLTELDFQNAAKLLKCKVAAVKAVAEVESSGDGFLSDGRVKILFEGHIFHKYTKGIYSGRYPTISYPKWTREFYTKGKTADIRGDGELKRLEKARELDNIAGLMSASYGKFQIMGFNFAACGYTDVVTFFDDMQKNEGEHLNAFCKYVISNGLDDELREIRWADFARRYNGPEYKKNQYDIKLSAAYVKYSRG